MRLSSCSFSRFFNSILTLAAFAAAFVPGYETECRESLFELAFEPLDDLDFAFYMCSNDLVSSFFAKVSRRLSNVSYTSLQPSFKQSH